MKKQNAALATPPNPAKEKTTWGEVCRQVGFADNLYRPCREKLGSSFTPAGGDMGAYDEDFEEDDIDIDRAVRKSALAVPPEPPKDWKYEPQGILEQFMYGDLTTKIMLYGGGALALWFAYDKFFGKKASSAPSTPSGNAMSALAALSGGATSPQSMPVPQVSNTAPTTVEIPASLRG